MNQYSHLIIDFASVCVRAFQKTDPDEHLSTLVYYEEHSHIHQIEAPCPASAFSILVLLSSNMHIGPRMHLLIKTVIATRTGLQRNALTRQHYATVAGLFLRRHQVRSFQWVFSITSDVSRANKYAVRCNLRTPCVLMKMHSTCPTIIENGNILRLSMSFSALLTFFHAQADLRKFWIRYLILMIAYHGRGGTFISTGPLTDGMIISSSLLGMRFSNTIRYRSKAFDLT